jgi:hypothetical protein
MSVAVASLRLDGGRFRKRFLLTEFQPIHLRGVIADDLERYVTWDMRPHLIITLLLIAQFFLVVMAFSPSLGLSKRTITTGWQSRQNPTPENLRAFKAEVARDKRHRYAVYWLCVINAVVLIIYGALRSTSVSQVSHTEVSQLSPPTAP